MSTATPSLCAAPRCRSVGHHWPDCTDGDCRGCQPRLAADGLRLCDRHTADIADDAREAGRLYDELALRLLGAGGSGEPVSGTPAARIPDPRAVEARTLIRHTLASWCRLVAEERGIALPADQVDAMGEYVARHHEWLAAHPAAGECAAELAELAHGRTRSLAYPSGARVVEIGACPHAGCEGVLRAIVRRSDALLPSEVVCSADEAHRWGAAQWHALGRAMSGREAA